MAFVGVKASSTDGDIWPSRHAVPVFYRSPPRGTSNRNPNVGSGYQQGRREVWSVRVAIVSTYPPRACGLATFSQALRTSLLEADGSTAVDVVSIVRAPNGRPPDEVVAAIQQDARCDYTAVGRRLSSRETDVVLIEHEYGIFGGEDGAFALSLIAELRQPVVLTLHTVLSRPSVGQAKTLRALCNRATLVTVFTETARRMVIGQHLVPPQRVRVIPHGAPIELRPPVDGRSDVIGTLERTGLPRPVMEFLEGRTVLSTFGLISSGKGIEVAIEALPSIIKCRPDVLYLVAGQTHPEVVKREGERYRLGLERLVTDLRLADHVQFVDRFFTNSQLAVLLRSTDVYLTPYRSREQIVSGALTFAVAAGRPVVSTPYFYAQDLLSSGAGVLVPFDDPEALAEGALGLLQNPTALATAGEESRRIGADLTWPAVGIATHKVLSEAIELGHDGDVGALLPAASGPGSRTDHLLTLVDDVGIIQHADGVIPNRATGYCVDDVARLVLVARALAPEDRAFERILARAISFLRHAWVADSHGMHNFMAYERRWLDDPHTGDHVGRAAWALADVVASSPPNVTAPPSLRLLHELVPILRRGSSLRCAAYTVIGLARVGPGTATPVLNDLLDTLARQVRESLSATCSEEWCWFEDVLTYDNARLPHALIAAGRRLGDDTMLADGLASLEWYGSQCGLDSSTVRLVGNRWRRRGQSVAPGDDEGDEQPLDAAALVEAFVEAMVVTGESAYGRRAVQAFEWFLGRNRLGLSVYDRATGGCHDGLSRDSLNENQGAEATLAYLQAALALDAAGLQASLPRC